MKESGSCFLENAFEMRIAQSSSKEF